MEKLELSSVIDLENELKNLFKKDYKGKRNDTFNEIVERGYVYCKPELDKKILFVGINPSYDEKPSYGYDLSKAKEHPHYKRIQKLVDLIDENIEWAYTDIFFFRETKQKKIYSLMGSEIGLNFICDQLRLTMKLLDFYKPSLIVVCNKGARLFFGIDKKSNLKEGYDNVWMGYEFDKNVNDEGYEKIIGLHPETIKKDKKTELIGTPIIFSQSLMYKNNKFFHDFAQHIKDVMTNEKLQVK